MEKPRFFERCMPIEVMAERGVETLAHGPMRPVGFSVDGKRPYALLQLRTENSEKTAFNPAKFATGSVYGSIVN